MPANNLLLSSSPHFFSAATTRKIMLAVIIALVPSTIYGVYLFGFHALLVVLASVVGAVGSEWLFRLATRQESHLSDCSAIVTGLLLALVLPPSIPVWMAFLGAIVAIVVAKEFFGGLGMNPFNPALIGRAFLLMSFPAPMTTWHKPLQGLVDAASGATPLNILKTGGSLQDVMSSVGVSNAGGLYWQLFLGNRSGSLGETSILLVAIGGIFLLAMGVIQFAVPLAMLASTALLSWAVGMDPLLAVLTGGVVFGAFFMATDYATSPLTLKGKILYGVGIGLLIVLIRRFGGFPEGVTYAILIMNMLSPFFDKLRTRKYGYVKPKKPAAPKDGSLTKAGVSK
jgi:electron transport complex protein RnfD